MFELKQVSTVHSARLMKYRRDRKTIYDLALRQTIERKTGATVLRTAPVRSSPLFPSLSISLATIIIEDLRDFKDTSMQHRYKMWSNRKVFVNVKRVWAIRLLMKRYVLLNYWRKKRIVQLPQHECVLTKLPKQKKNSVCVLVFLLPLRCVVNWHIKWMDTFLFGFNFSINSKIII